VTTAGDREPASRSRGAGDGIAWALAASAVALWLTALAAVDRDALSTMSELGLAPSLPPTFYAALGVLCVGFALVVRQRTPSTWLAGTHVAILIAIWHATPAILYGTPRYPFTYKHIGLAEFVQRRGLLDLDYDAYFNWPGFFTLSALVSDVAGLDTPFDLSVWAPVFMNVLIAVALLMLARSLTDDPRHAWLAVWWFLLANWVGQDYFAPQAFAYALHLTILGTYVTWFGHRRWWRHALPPVPDAVPRASSVGQRMGVLAILALTYAAIVAAHQLTPFVTLASLTALVLLRVGRAPLLPLAMLVLLATWFTYMTPPYLAGHLGELLAGVGRLFDNINAASRILASPADVVLSPERVLVLNVRQWLTIFMAALAVVGGIRRVRRGYVDWIAIVLLLMPASMIALQPYGGEIILRVFLFTLPLLAWFAAAIVFPDAASGRTWFAPVVVGAIGLVLAAGMSLAYYGNEGMNYVTPPENDVLERVYADAPDGAVIVNVTTNAPIRARGYERFTYLVLSRLEPFAPDDVPLDARVDALADLLAEREPPAAYVLLLRSEAANARLFGDLAHVDLDGLATELAASPRFEPLVSAPGAMAFTWVPPTTPFAPGDQP
jgi:hypothetical protein